MFVTEVIAAKIAEGTTKDGRPFHFCQTWIPADDGSLVFFNANEDLFPGDKIKVGISSYGSNIRLNFLGKV